MHVLVKTYIFWYNPAMKLRNSRLLNWWTQPNAQGGKTLARELVEFVLLVVLVVLPFRYFVAEPYIVSGVSMSNTFETGHYLIINKFWHKVSDPHRGDVLVFRSPVETDKYYIKRVIALPGETVIIDQSQVVIEQVNGERITLDEPYTSNPTFANIEVTLEEGEYFMMGDNRAQSFDSRAWGPLDESYIRGEPIIRLFPFGLLDTMPGRYDSYTQTN